MLSDHVVGAVVYADATVAVDTELPEGRDLRDGFPLTTPLAFGMACHELLIAKL